MTKLIKFYKKFLTIWKIWHTWKKMINPKNNILIAY